MKLKFTKMHGLGNDFVVIDNINQAVSLNSGQMRFLADRRFGIGCDQILLVDTADRPGVDFNYRIFNADGGEVEQCGNGARCFARFVVDNQLINKDIIVVSTSGGIIELRLLDNGEVTVDMGVPVLDPEKIPFQAKTRMSSYNLDIDGKEVTLSAVSMGNPHAVLLVEDTQAAPVNTLGPLIERHERFPNRTNVGFMQIVDSEHIRLRVHERGAGETLACGTGACAAVVAGNILGKLDRTVKVDLPGGRLTIEWAGDDSPVMMTGPATSVFEGTIEI